MKFESEAQRIKYEEDYKPAYKALMECYPFNVDAIVDEVWKPVAGYEEFYQVSTYGRIKSFQRKKPIIRKPQLDKDGYLHVGLSLDGKPKYFSVHVLVATAFIPNPDNKPEVNHRIGWKLNCHVSNLEWATHEENMEHAVKTGLQVAQKGTENSQAKIKDEEIIIYIRNNPDGLTGRQLAEMFGMAENTISDIQTGKYWGHVGGTIRKAKRPRVSDEIRDKIRADAATGKFSQSQLAEMYNVSRPTIWRIINEK
jgi:plasmid maintenance system antidote protein VapI